MIKKIVMYFRSILFNKKMQEICLCSRINVNGMFFNVTAIYINTRTGECEIKCEVSNEKNI